MGMLDRVFGSRRTGNEMDAVRNSRTDTTGSYLPTTQSGNYLDSLKSHGSAVLNKGVDFYKQNPKKVQAVGLLAAAALLAGMTRRR